MIGTLLPILVLASLASPQPRAAEQTASAPRSGKAAVAATVNINTATAAEFETLPGVGAKTAALIVEYRQKNGPFKKIEELMNIRGIGEKNFLKLKNQLTVGPAKTDHDQRPQH